MNPVLNLMDPEAGELDRQVTGQRYPSPERFIARCQSAMDCLKVYVCGVACAAAGQALAIVRSVYPSVRLDRSDRGFAQGTTDQQIETLVDEATDSAMKITDDLDLFSDAEAAVP